MTPDALNAIQHYTARCAITSSSMRGAAPGTVRAARNYLGQMSLKGLGTSDVSEFATLLDAMTDALLKQLPKDGRHWGRARKGLNIFLRGCLYTCYLRDEYRLGLGEAHFEMPLDSITGAKLVSESGDDLPQWGSVRDLKPSVSAKYQRAAAAVALARGVHRVHLDAMWWGRREDSDSE